MELELKRTFKGKEYTIGKLYIDGEYFCDTLEDVDRGLSNDMSDAECYRLKVKGETAIPTGEYEVTTKFVSAKFKHYKWAIPFNGRTPRLLNVPGFEGILVHPGNSKTDTQGCVLVGENKVKGQVINSQATYLRLMTILDKQTEPITITIS